MGYIWINGKENGSYYITVGECIGVAVLLGKNKHSLDMFLQPGSTLGRFGSGGRA